MKKRLQRFIFGCIIMLFAYPNTAQAQFELPYYPAGPGFSLGDKDSLYVMNIRFRVQSRVSLDSEAGDNLQIAESNARIERLRLRLDGLLYHENLTYIIQLGFSQLDMDMNTGPLPSVIQDAMLFYRFNEHITIGIGQAQLPGNRQRIMGSGDLQFVERSIINDYFGIDRDFGFQSYFREEFLGMDILFRGAVTSGSGQNTMDGQRSTALTGHFEILPFGEFENNGEYFEGDVEKEEEPRLALGATYSYNINAIRSGGQFGDELYQPLDTESYMADALFKFRGFSLLYEYIFKNVANSPLTFNEEGDMRHALVGRGSTFQGGMFVSENLEFSLRYARISPDRRISFVEDFHEAFTVGANRYIKGHRLKFQTDLTYMAFDGNRQWAAEDNYWQFRFQIELGL